MAMPLQDRAVFLDQRVMLQVANNNTGEDQMQRHEEMGKQVGQSLLRTEERGDNAGKQIAERTKLSYLDDSAGC